jgi:hypothetical protein
MFRIDGDDVLGRLKRGDPLARHTLDAQPHLALSFGGE